MQPEVFFPLQIELMCIMRVLSETVFHVFVQLTASAHITEKEEKVFTCTDFHGKRMKWEFCLVNLSIRPRWLLLITTASFSDDTATIYCRPTSALVSMELDFDGATTKLIPFI